MKTVCIRVSVQGRNARVVGLDGRCLKEGVTKGGMEFFMQG